MSSWLFDGCYFSEGMYRHADAPNFGSFAAAARAGNAANLVSFNGGEGKERIAAFSDAEDFSCGEVNEPENVACDGRWLEGKNGHREQFHLWSYAGEFWGKGAPRFSDAQVLALTRRITAQQGVVTWDIPINNDGAIASDFLAQLESLKQGLN